jgi:acyl carrier protein
MNLEDVKTIVTGIVSDYCESQEIQVKVNGETRLVGMKAEIDSLGLVTIIIDLESRFLDDGYEISLTSEKAMSQKNSPFRSVDTLTQFIFEQIEHTE